MFVADVFFEALMNPSISGITAAEIINEVRRGCAPRFSQRRAERSPRRDPEAREAASASAKTRGDGPCT